LFFVVIVIHRFQVRLSTLSRAVHTRARAEGPASPAAADSSGQAGRQTLRLAALDVGAQVQLP
jgi:hypothetical protein